MDKTTMNDLTRLKEQFAFHYEMAQAIIEQLEMLFKSKK